MATTDQINDLINNYTDLKAFYEGERQALESARNNLPAHMHRTVYVDEINGLAGGDGTFAAPYDTVDKAIDSFANSQNGSIKLLSDVTWRDQYSGFRGQLSFLGTAGDNSTTQRRTLSFAAAAGNTNQAPGAHVLFGALRFSEVNIVLGGGVDPFHFRTQGTCFLAFENSDIVGSQGGTTALLEVGAGTGGISVTQTTTTGMAGRWVSGVAAGATLDTASSGLLIDPAISNV